MRKTVAIAGVAASLTIIFGGTALAETTMGTPGSDSIAGTGDADTIKAGPGDDLVNGFSGNDTIDGGPGRDSLRGGDGDDFVQGAAATTPSTSGMKAPTVLIAVAVPTSSTPVRKI